MQVAITGRRMDVTDDVRDYINEKAGRLPRFYSRIHEIEVILAQESEQYSVEMVVRAGRKHTFVAAETGPDTFALLDLVTDKIERQIKKHKEKEQDHGNKDTRPSADENA